MSRPLTAQPPPVEVLLPPGGGTPDVLCRDGRRRDVQVLPQPDGRLPVRLWGPDTVDAAPRPEPEGRVIDYRQTGTGA